MIDLFLTIDKLDIANNLYHKKMHLYLCYHEKGQSFINECTTKYNDEGQ